MSSWVVGLRMCHRHVVSEYLTDILLKRLDRGRSTLGGSEGDRRRD